VNIIKKQILIIATATRILFSGIHGTASASKNINAVKLGKTLWEISYSNH
jgi:hypothetical protein